MAANTTNYALLQPTVSGDADVWGGYLNLGIAAVDKLLGIITTGGSANAYTLTSGQSLAAYVSGQSFLIKASFGNTSTATLNVDGLGAKAITKNGTTALASGDLASGQVYRVAYDGTQFQVVGVLSGIYQLLAANLTALAGQTWAADQVTYQTGAAAVANLAFPGASRTQIAAGLGSVAVKAYGTSGAAIGLLNDNKTDSGANTFTAQQTFSAAGPPIVLNVASGTNYVADLKSGGTRTGYLYSDATNFILQSPSASNVLIVPWGGGAASFLTRPNFNGNAALDVANGAQLGAVNAFSAAGTIATFNSSASSYVVGISTGGTTGGYVGTNSTALRLADSTLATDVQIAAGVVSIHGGDLVLASIAPTSTLSAGFLGIPLIGGAAINAAKTFDSGSMGRCGYHDEVTARTWTIDSNANYAAPIGSFVVIDNTGNSGSAGTITLGITTDTLRRGDGVAGTGSRTISAGQVATVRKTKSTEWVICGSFS